MFLKLFSRRHHHVAEHFLHQGSHHLEVAVLSSDVAQEVVVPVSGVLEAMRASQLHSTMLGHPVPLETSPALVVGLARYTGVALTKLDVTAPELASRINLTIQDA